MITVIDGFDFSNPIDPNEVKALAKFHRKQLGEAIYHAEDHIGNIGIAQRVKIANFTHGLEPQQKVEFYKIYNKELHRLAVDDPIHPPHSEHGVNVFLLVVTLIITATILYFAFIPHVVNSSQV